MVESFGKGHHEGSPVLMWVFQPEFDIRNQSALQAFNGLSGLFHDLAELLDQPCKGFPAHLIEQFGLVFEIDVNGRGRILDSVGNASHGHVFVTVAHEQLARSVQDLLTKVLLLSCPALLDSHLNCAPLTYLTPLIVHPQTLVCQAVPPGTRVAGMCQMHDGYWNGLYRHDKSAVENYLLVGLRV